MIAKSIRAMGKWLLVLRQGKRQVIGYRTSFPALTSYRAYINDEISLTEYRNAPSAPQREPIYSDDLS